VLAAKTLHRKSNRAWTSGVLLGFLASLICCSSASAGAVSFHVIDGSGADTKDVLVIVQDLRVRDSDEVFRALTDAQGRVPASRLEKGLYRMIAVTPYGLWEPFVREFLVGAADSEMVVRLKPLPTHGYGDVITVPPQGSTLLEIRKRDGTPAQGVDVHVRDAEATLHTRQWYKTDAKGQATIQDVGKNTVAIVVFNGDLITRTIKFGTDRVIIILP
jgi:5-hydroxyisourate hydrolase-like protein (transthyretin family)